MFYIAGIGAANPAHAETISVSLGELQSALDNAAEQKDSVSLELLSRISETLESAELGFANGELLYQSNDSNITLEGGCNNTEILQVDTDIVLASNTTLSLELNSLYDPIVVSVNVQANVDSHGVGRSIAGIRLGDCQNIARDTFEFHASGQASFSISVSLFLEPMWTSPSTLTLNPIISLIGELEAQSSNVNVEDTVLASLIESYIEDEINNTLTNERLTTELASLQSSTNEKLKDSLTDGRIDIKLPEEDNEQILALYQLLQPDARFPITLDMIRRNRRELLSSVLFGEPNSPGAILADAVLCESAAAFLSKPVTLPVYAGSSEQCDVVRDFSVQNTELWADENCTQALNYEPTSIGAYCDVALDPTRLGNAASRPEQLAQWTHSPGSRFDISALSVDGLTQPFVRRFNFKQVETPRGFCELEMRVYSLSADQQAQPQKPLLALHGGSWQHRASGFVGIEAMATHFVNEGFVVFAPFYRLVGETDGNVACNDASLANILDDVNDALNWVQARESDFGVQGKTTVFGQSAGGHLALSLATHRAQEIRRAILFYAPTDFSDFAQQIQTGAYTNPTGLKILEAVTGQAIDTLDLSSTLVVDNSFPALVAAAPEAFPPIFMLHGEMDSLLHFRQSVRLCNALGGSSNYNMGEASLMPNLTGFATRTQCSNNGSQLHLIAEGEHALDLCLAKGLCLSGSADSADEVAQSMRSMLAWSSADSVDSGKASGDGLFAGGLVWPSLTGLFFIRLFRIPGFGIRFFITVDSNGN